MGIKEISTKDCRGRWFGLGVRFAQLGKITRLWTVESSFYCLQSSKLEVLGHSMEDPDKNKSPLLWLSVSRHYWATPKVEPSLNLDPSGRDLVRSVVGTTPGLSTRVTVIVSLQCFTVTPKMTCPKREKVSTEVRSWPTRRSREFISRKLGLGKEPSETSRSDQIPGDVYW